MRKLQWDDLLAVFRGQQTRKRKRKMGSIKAKYIKSKNQVQVRGYTDEEVVRLEAAMEPLMEKYGFSLADEPGAAHEPGAVMTFEDALAPQDDDCVDDRLEILSTRAPIKMSVSRTKRGKLYVTASMGMGNVSNANTCYEALLRAWKSWCRQGRPVNGIEVQTALDEKVEELNRGAGWAAQ